MKRPNLSAAALLLPLLCFAAGTALAQSSSGQPSGNAALGHGLSILATVIYSVAVLGLGIYALVSFFEIKEPGDPQMRVARNAALFMLLFEVAAVALRTSPMTGQAVAILIIGDAIYFLKLIIAIYVGIHLWQRAGKDYWGLAMWKTDRIRLLSISSAAIAVAVLYTIALFSWLRPSAGWAIKALNAGHASSASGAIALSLIAGAEFAFGEEFLYRGCFQPILATMCRGASPASWQPIVGIALIWTFGHAGSLSLDWVKYLQMFPLGLFLGWWYGRAGFIGSLLVHLGFNTIIILIAGHLLPG